MTGRDECAGALLADEHPVNPGLPGPIGLGFVDRRTPLRAAREIPTSAHELSIARAAAVRERQLRDVRRERLRRRAVEGELPNPIALDPKVHVFLAGMLPDRMRPPTLDDPLPVPAPLNEEEGVMERTRGEHVTIDKRVDDVDEILIARRYLGNRLLDLHRQVLIASQHHPNRISR